MPQAFGGTDESVLVLKATTAGELKAAFEKAAEATDKLVMLEVMTDKYDVPPLLADITTALKPKADA